MASIDGEWTYSRSSKNGLDISKYTHVSGLTFESPFQLSGTDLKQVLEGTYEENRTAKKRRRTLKAQVQIDTGNTKEDTFVFQNLNKDLKRIQKSVEEQNDKKYAGIISSVNRQQDNIKAIKAKMAQETKKKRDVSLKLTKLINGLNRKRNELRKRQVKSEKYFLSCCQAVESKFLQEMGKLKDKQSDFQQYINSEMQQIQQGHKILQRLIKSEGEKETETQRRIGFEMQEIKNKQTSLKEMVINFQPKQVNVAVANDAVFKQLQKDIITHVLNGGLKKARWIDVAAGMDCGERYKTLTIKTFSLTNSIIESWNNYIPSGSISLKDFNFNLKSVVIFERKIVTGVERDELIKEKRPSLIRVSIDMRKPVKLDFYNTESTGKNAIFIALSYFRRCEQMDNLGNWRDY